MGFGWAAPGVALTAPGVAPTPLVCSGSGVWSVTFGPLPELVSVGWSRGCWGPVLSISNSGRGRRGLGRWWSTAVALSCGECCRS